jgi:hypothetical protein
MIKKMVKCLLTYESDERDWIESFEYMKSYEALAYIIRRKDDDGVIDTEINEVCTSKPDLIKLRDFLNSLNLESE